jgi:hypothetical protein
MYKISKVQKRGRTLIYFFLEASLAADKQSKAEKQARQPMQAASPSSIPPLVCV